MERKPKRKHESRVQGYLNPKTSRLFKKYVKVEEFESESKALNHILKQYFANMPDASRVKYL